MWIGLISDLPGRLLLTSYLIGHIYLVEEASLVCIIDTSKPVRGTAMRQNSVVGELPADRRTGVVAYVGRHFQTFCYGSSRSL